MKVGSKVKILKEPAGTYGLESMVGMTGTILKVDDFPYDDMDKAMIYKVRIDGIVGRYWFSKTELEKIDA